MYDEWPAWRSHGSAGTSSSPSVPESPSSYATGWEAPAPGGQVVTWVAPEDPTEVAPAESDRDVPPRADVQLRTELPYGKVLENPPHLVRGSDRPCARGSCSLLGDRAITGW